MERIAYVIVMDTTFSVINYAVLITIILSFVIFGLLGISFRKTMPVWRAWSLSAGIFGGALGLGWSFALISS